MSDGAQMDLLTRIEASLEFMNDGGPIRVDFVNLREVLEGSREALRKLETSQVALKGAEERAKMLLDAKSHWAERARTAESRLGSAENRFALAQKCINQIDDYLEYRWHGAEPEAIRRRILDYIAEYANDVSTQPAPVVETPVTEQCGRGDRRSDS